mmetsp:Transcript_12383/g.37074  ORF Transcript_12383/g.37074 Transcript_12383/m.37074 type:complete len:445 (+) Transcript_12383:1902-3236(+)
MVTSSAPAASPRAAHAPWSPAVATMPTTASSSESTSTRADAESEPTAASSVDSPTAIPETRPSSETVATVPLLDESATPAPAGVSSAPSMRSSASVPCRASLLEETTADARTRACAKAEAVHGKRLSGSGVTVPRRRTAPPVPVACRRASSVSPPARATCTMAVASSPAMATVTLANAGVPGPVHVPTTSTSGAAPPSPAPGASATRHPAAPVASPPGRATDTTRSEAVDTSVVLPSAYASVTRRGVREGSGDAAAPAGPSTSSSGEARASRSGTAVRDTGLASGTRTCTGASAEAPQPLYSARTRYSHSRWAAPVTSTRHSSSAPARTRRLPVSDVTFSDLGGTCASSPSEKCAMTTTTPESPMPRSACSAARRARTPSTTGASSLASPVVAARSSTARGPAPSGFQRAPVTTDALRPVTNTCVARLTRTTADSDAAAAPRVL